MFMKDIVIAFAELKSPDRITCSQDSPDNPPFAVEKLHVVLLG